MVKLTRVYCDTQVNISNSAFTYEYNNCYNNREASVGFFEDKGD